MKVGGDSSVKENKESCVESAKGKAVVVMDTPERSKNSQITTSVNTFEDSPVFNFLNNLSPIKPVKSIHISQTINPLSFASLPSVFTSPHLNSLKESRFLRRHQLPDPSKPEFASDDAHTVDTRKDIIHANNESDEHQANFDQPSSVGQVVGEAYFECSELVAEFEQSFKYDCSSPGSSLTPSCALKTKHIAEYARTSSALIPFVEEASLRGLFGSEVDLDGVSQIDQNKEATRCEWENLISDAPDQLIFESPNDAESYKNSSISNDMQHTYSFCEADSSEKAEEENETENQCTQPGEGSELKEISETHDIISGSSMTIPIEEVDNEPVSGLYRGMRRRCLVFEMVGSRRKRFDENSVSDSSAFLQSDVNTSTSNEKILPTKAGNDSSQRSLPGIGLHLNALTTTPKDYKFLKHEALGSGRLLIGPSPNANFQPPTSGQELLNNSLAVNSEREISVVENGILAEDACQASGYMINEEFNQSSPKKKRRRLDQAGDGEACKRCNCKKSKCLKLYCECFAAGVYCVEPCACIDCFNTPVHEDTVLATRKQIESRNPLAFAPKVIRSSDYLSETRDESSKTPASARHKRGCNCKKSGCLKKYCECYQGGVGCSVNCRCEGCKNAFGRKDGTEAEFDEDETDTAEKGLQKLAIQNDLEQNPDSVLPATPLKQGRQTIQHLFSSKNKLPRPSFPSIGSSSGSYASHGFRKPSFFQPPARFDKHLETVLEDEMPDFLQAQSPISCIKTSSPNSKRVSPPHRIGTSPSMRSSRKLILQSIPAFPSLTPNN
ncbi:protein tesmin/TSO1-like CXC 2 isoform X2 [Olea europaea var. sylvestris]|uniref:protein tesmin/TSO1-like CXC 2 isoform X2 n=1 Tax=Olea europaea var. sylvestris TaxID=158386 RepID=UPI000C1CF386|nr:protein tesmin/TSO1-like CXC 2 isoform X2 [Olea europaea var. sylvestris]